MSNTVRHLAFIALSVAGMLPAFADTAPRADQAAFRELYKELVETNTTLSAGSCTLAASRMAARLRSAGFPETDVQVVVAPEHPEEGALVANLRAPRPKAKALLLLAHIDVVEARREDWTRDPFTLVEEDGYFHARGAADDKAMAAIWVDTLIRLRQEGFKPRRDIKIALTCGEETIEAFDSVPYLLAHHRELIDASFALNEGGYGQLDEQGRRVMFGVQAGEKTPQDFRLEVTNAGGHSARPVKDNAIYHLAAGLTRLSQHDFPIVLNDTTRSYFERMATIQGGETGAAMKALAANPDDAGAAALVTANPVWNAMLRTTCVATMLDGGHATNALPQRARANINCRIFPGVPVDEVQRTLEQVLADPAIKVTALATRAPVAAPPAFTPAILRPIEELVAEMYAGVPIVPMQSSGYTDGQFLNAAGIPTYGVRMFLDPDFGHVHGLNERIRVQSVYEGRDFLHALVKKYASATR
ncbi:acetylornithine deacetylase/succinyl-diaminopimelate desuccinylase-like protein [Panacagrimonas perspica]|uniref:Acetylornithine deacetylase/succinyl-diaminopimelate desuccinylase-like protein n=1 Tax=Panacagrimonas perspica TaxID=381431 RepID=A0A4R7PET3_9GAMM|nr:M20/M25/M40 family metallo-hydrolase [Panacagrimonas perspica]TDU32678.1 acetylornithine deacetylase/succinyl-diaminopimelate desuccinylase-like protein [Panacagrimonas perspica]THD05563.1 peptidase M20 [Panacagrimonas perspica]